ncbi:MAG: hypothetical protein ACW976_02340 [Candidatus Ranarchaeia archaeon]|jgi:hypothetical protein
MQEPQELHCDMEGSQSLILPVGDQFSFSYHRHHSVGVDYEFTISDTTVIELIAHDHEYLHPERMKPGWTGGDKERCRWVFQAMNLGEATLTIRKVFRGEVEHTCVFRTSTISDT